MLVVRGQNGYVAWVFRYINSTTKAAVCLQDNFEVNYLPSPSAAWSGLLTSIVAHSVTLVGAFVDSFWIGV